MAKRFDLLVTRSSIKQRLWKERAFPLRTSTAFASPSAFRLLHTSRVPQKPSLSLHLVTSTTRIFQRSVLASSSFSSLSHRGFASSPDPTPTLWEKTKEIFKGYGEGLKGLLQGWKAYYYLRQKDTQQLTWEEIQTINRVKRDTFRSLPIFIIFVTPIIGYLTPVFAILFPALLPPSFATPAQRQQFLLEAEQRRRKAAISIVDILYSIPDLKLPATQIRNKQLSDVELSNLCPTIESLIPLSQLSRAHLLAFDSFIDMPYASILPSFFIRKRLANHVKHILNGDRVLRETTLTADVIRQACAERGIPASNVYLWDWLRITENVKPTSESFLLHALVIKHVQTLQ